MKNSSSGYHHNIQSDPNALRKKTIRKNLSQSNINGDQNKSLRISTTHPPYTDVPVSNINGDQNKSLRISTTHPPYTDVPVSPLSKSPWASNELLAESHSPTGLRGSLVREKGHIYSLAAAGDLLYTGSESKNIRVWKNQKELSGFKSSSGFVKSIVVDADRVLSGHQDGKIRIWRPSHKNPTLYKRIGSMPTFKAKIKSSFKHSIKHLDAISCLTLSEDKLLLYSGSWDKTFKVWRVSDSKCLESVKAHDDAVNSIIAAFGGAVLTGSADGSIRVWKREMIGNKGKAKHTLSRTLLQQESAVTALAADPSTAFLYGGSSDGTVIFWGQDKSGNFLHGGVLRGHKLAVLCLATSGRLVFSGSADTNICVWQRSGNGNGTHTCLSVLSGHGGPVKCLAVVEDIDGQYVVYSGSIDKSVKIWRATEVVEMPAAADDFNNPWADFSKVEVGLGGMR